MVQKSRSSRADDPDTGTDYALIAMITGAAVVALIYIILI
jgi:hypothetical protein